MVVTAVISTRAGRSRLRRVTVAVALALAAGALPATAGLARPAVPGHSLAKKASLTAAPAQGIAGEPLSLTGKVAPALARKVVLQLKQGSAWQTVAKGRSSAKGAFSFRTTFPAASATYRVQAPRTTVKGRAYAATTTPSRAVTTQQQTSTWSLPATGAVGTTVAVAGSFAPARTGRAVHLEELVGGAWTSRDDDQEDAAGAVGYSLVLGVAGTHTYRLVAQPSGGAAAATSSTRSIVVQPATVPDTTPPGPVTALSVTGKTTTSVSLAWTNPGDADLVGVVVRRATGPTPPASPTSGTAVGDVAKPGASITDSGLSAGTQYSYALFAKDAVPNYATPATLTTNTLSTPDVTPPGPVTGLSVTGTTTTSVSLSWTNPGDADFAGVVVRRAASATPPGSPTSGTAVGTIAKPGASLTDSGLTPGTQYAYALFAADAVPNYAAAATVTASTPSVPDTTPPGPVTGLSVTGTTTTSVSLSWTNPVDADFAGVVVRRAAGATPPASPTSGTAVGTIAKPGASLTDSGLTPGTQYAYALFAADAVPNYAAGATTTATTLAAPDTTPPGPVTGLAVSGSTSTTVSLSWTNPAAADLTGVLVRRAQGATPPATPASGTLVADVPKPGTGVTDTGLAPSTQYSYAVFAHDGVPNHATGVTLTTTTPAAPAATTGDWAQSRHDAEHRGWSPTETVITPANAASVAEEWTTEGGTPAVVGNTLYTLTVDPLTDHGRLTAFDLTTGGELWRIGTGTCLSGPVAVAGTRIILGCSQPRAYATDGTHALLWDTADTDPGQSVQNFLVLDNRVVAWGGSDVVSYQLSDGQRVWAQLLPAGAGSIFDVAASGTTVVVAYDDRLRGLAAGNGAQQWSAPGVFSSQLVIAGGFVYTNDDAGVSRYTLAGGTPDGWTVPDGSDIYQVVAADADTVYVWEAVFDFGPPSPSVLHALRTSDGVQRWQSDVPSRIRSVAVAGDVVWLTSSEIFSQGRNGDLIALNRATGAELRHVNWDDNIYGSYDVAFAGGKVVLHQGGSFGGSTPSTLRVFGLAGPRPRMTTPVLPLGRTGSPYTAQLAATGGASFTWTVQSGALPAGLSLSGSGLVSGTPTTAGTSRVVVKVTGANGRSTTRSLPVGVVASATPTWTTTSRDATRNPLEPGTGQLDLSEAPTFGFRWKTAPPGPTTSGGDQDVVLGAGVMYTVAWDGKLAAYDTTGSQANRLPLWAVDPPAGTGAGFTGQPTISGTTLLVFDTSGALHAVSTAGGAPLWHTDPLNGPTDAPLVVGGSVYVRDNQLKVRGYAVAGGAPRWSGDPAAVPSAASPLSSDGTRLFTVSNCDLYAVTLADGSVAWHDPVRLDAPSDCNTGLFPPAAPVVVGGKVHGSEPAGKIVADAATGAVSLRFDNFGYNLGTSVVVGGLWVFEIDNRIVAVDTTTGELAWRSADVFAALPRFSATGDLVLVATGSSLQGLSRLTGETVWDGGTVQGVGGSPAIGTNRFFVADVGGTRAYGPL